MSRCDVAIIGAGLAGLAAGALLAHAGKRVVLADAEQAAGGILAGHEEAGLLFNAGLPVVFGLGTGGVARLRKTLGLSEEPRLLPASYQVALPDRRVTVLPEREATLEELRREFPRDIDSLASLFREMQDLARAIENRKITSAFVRWRSAAGVLRKRRFSAQCIAYFDVQARSFFGRTIEELPLREFVELIDSRPAVLEGGIPELVCELREAFERRGGELLLGEPWPVIATPTKRLKEVQFSTPSLEARSFLVNLPEANQGPVLFLETDAEVIPVGMQDAVLCLPDYAKPQALTVITLDQDRRTSAGEKGSRALTASFSGGSAPQDHESALRSLQNIMPFLDQFTVRSMVRGDEDRKTWGAALQDAWVPYRRTAMRINRSVRNVYAVPDQLLGIKLSLEAAVAAAAHVR